MTTLLAAAVVSTFVAKGAGTAWLRLDVANPKAATVVASFPGPPAGARTAWSKDRKRGAVFFDPQNRGFVHSREEPAPSGLAPRVFLVDLPTHATRALPLPAVGTLHDVGFDAAGALLALTEQEVKLAEDKHGRGYVDFEGKRYTRDPGREGTPVLVHAFTLQPDHRWKRTETLISDEGWDYAQGVRALKSAQGLGTRSSQWLDSRLERAEVKDAGARARLHALAPKLVEREGDGWARLPGNPGPVYFWTRTGEFCHAIGRIAFEVGGKATWAPGLPWADDDAVALNRAGNYVMATCAGSGSHPRVWDVPSRKLVWHEDAAWDTVFWP